MVNKKISELPAAATITGTEIVPLVQGGTTKAATVTQLLALVVASAPGNLDTFFEVATQMGLDEATVTTLQALVASKADAASVAATYVSFGPTAPDHTISPVWVDTSVTPQVVKGWNGTTWAAIGGGTGGGAVSSVAGRTGAVVLAEADITGLSGDLAAKAPLASPAFSGTPTIAGAAVAKTTDITSAIAALVGAAPAALDTLSEIDAQIAADEGSAAALSALVATKAASLTTQATSTALSGTLSTDTVNPIDATAGPATRTLPTPTKVGQVIAVEKTDATTNTITVTGTIRGSSSSSVALAWQYETLGLVAESLTSWRPVFGHKTKAALDKAYDAKGAATTAARGYFRGVNSQGGDANIDDGTQVPGVSGVNYWYNSQAHYDYLASRGHTLVRIGFLWERVQPTLGGALDTAGIAALKAVVQRAVNSGLRVVLDMKNYGRFWVNSTTRAMLGNGITQAQFADVWTKLATAFAGAPGDICFGLMNEPYGLPTLPSTFVSTGTIDSFDTTIEGWTAGNGSATPTLTVGSYAGMTGAGALTASQANTGATTQIISVQSPSGSGVGSMSLPTGSVLQFEVYVPVSNGGTLWQVRPSIIDTSFGSVYGSYAAITPGTVTKVTMPIPDAQAGTNHHQLFVEFTGDGLSGSGTLVGQVGDIQIGTAAANPTTVWKQFSQAAVTAIRATGDTHDLSIAGDQFDGAWGFPSIDGAPWITDPYTARDAILYEAHVYLDHDRSGSYASGSYAAENTADVNAGWLSLLARVQSDCNTFVGWLAQYGKRGFIGEIGWPSTFDAALWNTAAQACYDIFNAAGLDVAYWVTGENLSGTGPGGLYLEDLYFRNNYVPQAQAAVVEATRNLSKQTAKVSAAHAIETLAKVRPTGQWDFTSAPTVAGVAIGGAAVPEYSIAAGNWWTPSVAATGTGSLSVAGVAVMFPIMLPATQNIDQLALEVTTAGGAGGLLGAAIYGHGADGLPNFSNLIVEFPAVASTATGIKTLPATAAVQLPKGLVWVGVVARTATCTVRTVSNGYPTAVPLPSGITPTAGTNIQVFNIGASTAFPSSGALGQGTILMSPPKVWLHGA